MQGAYPAPTIDGPVHAELTIPGSKSLTNRELLIAAIADGPGRLIAPLHSDDSQRMVEALRALGVGIEEVDAGHEFGPDLVITPGKLRGGTTIDCGQAGTVMRFIAPLAGLAEQDVHLTAHETALHRPMGGLISALRDLGVDIDDEGTWALRSPSAATVTSAAVAWRSTRRPPASSCPGCFWPLHASTSACTSCTPASGCRACRTST